MHLQSLSKLDECEFEAPEVANISVLVQRSNEYFQQERSFFEQVSSKGVWPVTGDTPRVSEGHNLSILNITIPSVESLPQRPQLYGANSNRGKRKSILDKVPAHQQILFTKCQATELPHTLLAQVAFKEIRLLDLSHNKLRTIPRELLIQLKTLEVLKINSNFIKQLPVELFARGKCLKYLAAANNLLTRLPDLAPEECDVLEDDDDNIFEVENFKLTKGQASFENNGNNNSIAYSAKYCNIEYLDLSINKLQEISPLFALALPCLHQLHLNTNDFGFLPTSLHTLQRLEEFSLDWYQYAIPSLPITQNSQKSIQLLRDYLQSVFKQHIPVISFCDFIRHFSRFAIDTASYKFQQQFLVHRAAFNEDIGALKSILQLYPESLNQLDNEGHTPLSTAILAEKLFSVRLLLESGVNVNEGAANLYGSPLNIATLKGLQVVIKDLLQRGAEVFRQDFDGNTALHYAMSVFNSRGVQNSCQIVSILLEYGADPNAKNKEGWTPLHLAVRKGQIDGVLFVIEHNKNNSKQRLSTSQQDSVSSQQTRHRNNQRQLFNLNCKGSQQLLTPLHVAVLINQLSIVEILIDEPSVNYLARNHLNQAARQLASKDLLMSKKMLLEEKRALKKIITSNDVLKLSQRLSEVFPFLTQSNEKNRDKPTIRIMNFEQKFALNTRNAEFEDSHAQTARELLTSPKETKFLQFSVSRNMVGQQVPEKHLEDDDDCDANFDALQGYSPNDEVEAEHEALMFLQPQNAAAAKRFFNQISLHKLDTEAAEDAQVINCINPSQIARVCHTRKELYTSNTVPSRFSEMNPYSSSSRIKQDKQAMLVRRSAGNYAIRNSVNICQQQLSDSQTITRMPEGQQRKNGLRSSQNQPLDSRIIQYRVETQQGEPSALHIPKLCSQIEKDQAQHFFQRLRNIVECHSSSIDGTVQQLLSHVTPISDKFRCYARILKSSTEIDLSMQEICQLLQYSHLTLSQACKELLRKGSSLTAEAASKIIQQLNQPQTFDYAQLMRESEEICCGDGFDSGYQHYSHQQQHSQQKNYTELDDDFLTQNKDQQLTHSFKQQQQQFMKSDSEQTLKEFAFATLGRRALTLFKQKTSYQEDSKQQRALLRQFCAREARQAAIPPAKCDQTNASQSNYSLLIAYEAMQASHTAAIGEQSWSESRTENSSIRNGANRPVKPLFLIGQYSTVYDSKKRVQDMNSKTVSNSSQGIVATAQQTTMPSEYFLTQGKIITDSGVTLHTDDDVVVVMSANTATRKPHSLTAREVTNKSNMNSKFWNMKNEHDFQKEVKIRENTPEILINKGEPLLDSPQFFEDEDADLDFSSESPVTQRFSFKMVNDSNIKSAQIKNRK